MLAVPATVTVELIEHADGRPVAYIDATGIAVFVQQLTDGAYIVDICTRDRAGEHMSVLLDGAPVASAVSTNVRRFRQLGGST